MKDTGSTNYRPKEVRNGNEQKTKNQAQQIFITCDVFDTILMRHKPPRAVFEEVGRRMHLNQFSRMRQHAESKMRSPTTGEVCLDSIYDHIQRNYPAPRPTFWDEVKSQELSVEKETCLPTEKSREFLERIRQQTEHLVFLSDMYLPASFIKSMLKEHGIFTEGDSLIVSCEIDASKSNGGAFAWVEEKFNPKNWHHFGDNLYSDYLIPRRHGIQATWRPKSLSEQIMQATKFTAKYILNAGKYPKK